MHYSGDMKPIALATGTALNTGTEVVLSTVVEVAVGRILKPMFYVIASAATGGTGSMTITYSERIADLPPLENKELVVTLVEIDGAYYGISAITTDYSTLRLVDFTNSTDKDMTAYEIGVTGLIMYE